MYICKLGNKKRSVITVSWFRKHVLSWPCTCQSTVRLWPTQKKTKEKKKAFYILQFIFILMSGHAAAHSVSRLIIPAIRSSPECPANEATLPATATSRPENSGSRACWLGEETKTQITFSVLKLVNIYHLNRRNYNSLYRIESCYH
jgi:hypothetical protein